MRTIRIFIPDMGIQLEQGAARFTGPHTIEVTDRSGAASTFTSRYFIIAAGSSAMVPPDSRPGRLPPYLTNYTGFFELQSQPESMVIIGAGPIGIENGPGV